MTYLCQTAAPLTTVDDGGTAAGAARMPWAGFEETPDLRFGHRMAAASTAIARPELIVTLLDPPHRSQNLHS